MRKGEAQKHFRDRDNPAMERKKGDINRRKQKLEMSSKAQDRKVQRCRK